MKLNKEQEKNILLLYEAMIKHGITNIYTQTAILSIIGKESMFIPKSEQSYRNTSLERIRKIFGKRVESLSDDELRKLSQNDYEFFERVYGANSGVLLGNKYAGDGYKFRGRGFNQITGRYAYEKYGKMMGLDLVNNPDLLNDTKIAAEATILFFKNRFLEKGNKLNLYNANNINDFKNLTDSLNAVYHANAGWGKSLESINKDVTGGKAMAAKIAGFLKDYISINIKQEELKKKSMIKNVVLPLFIISGMVLIFYLYKKNKRK
ncbi:MAG: glycoside hydrolase family 19 protein [Candidatus Woesearchaeota archaeon]